MSRRVAVPAGPVVHLRSAKLARIYFVVMVASLVVAFAAGTVAAVALSHSNSTGKCVNDVLGDRAPLTAADNRATRQIADGVNRLLTIDPASSSVKQQAVIMQIKVEIASAKATLENDQQERLKNPLGRC